jgi:hypothetical protein
VEDHTKHSVYTHPDGRREVIKHGFSWPAFILGPLWAWRKGMVSLGFGLLGIHLSLQMLPVIFLDFMAEGGILLDLIVSLGVLIWIGGQGNTWLRKSALSRGFTLVQAPTSAEVGGSFPRG